MNWKLIAALMVGAVLVSACGASTKEATMPAPGTGATRGAEVEKADVPATEGAAATQPAAAPAAPSKDAKKDIVVHD